MIVVRCSELTTDEQLALAEHITSDLGGDALALARGKDIVIDGLGKGEPPIERVEGAVREFIAGRKDSSLWSCERNGDDLVVHPADPVRSMSGRRKPRLPDNLFKCPFCGFVTPYEELYVVHYRAHGFT